VTARRRARPRAVLALLLGAIGAAHADRLVLESGGRIDVERWWVDGDWIRYESAGGTVGLPRSAVVRIEPGPPPARAPRSSVAAPDAPAPPAAAPELAARLDRARGALESRDFERAAGAYGEIVRERPGLLAARVGLAVSQIALGRDGSALGVVLDGLALDPQRPELLELLGDLRAREDRVDDALAAWQRAFDVSPLDRLRDKIVKARRELQAGGDFDVAASAHFNLRYDGRIDADLAAEVRDWLESQFWELSELFEHTPEQPITVVLYATREFRDVTLTPEWVGGVYDGKIRVPLGGLHRLDPLARRVLRHELTHAVVHAKTHGNCPRWLHEGLAQIAEGRTLTRADRAALAGLPPLSPADDFADAKLAYPAALSRTRWLEQRRGFSALLDLLERLAAGDPIERAVQKVYGDPLSELNRRWRDDLAAETP